MPSILFIHSHTLYAKVTIPVALECVRKGWKVALQVNRPVFFDKSYGFTENVIMNNPTSVNILNPESYEYVAELIGLGSSWNRLKEKLYFSFSGELFAGKFDIVVGTTKDIPKLWRVYHKGVRSIALGYQHLPVISVLGEENSCNNIDSIFFSDNLFSNKHYFNGIVSGASTALSAFTNLDFVYKIKKNITSCSDTVLIFHPGGYRNVLTQPNASRDESYSKQKEFIERMAIPIIRRGLSVVIKVHPLRAKFHDKNDLEVLVGEITKSYNLVNDSIKILSPQELYWNTAFNSRFVLTFGSSSVYELWSAGITNVYVCNFQGPERSVKFEIFDEIFINSYESYLKFVDQDSHDICLENKLTMSVISAYGELFDGGSVNKSIMQIEKSL